MKRVIYALSLIFSALIFISCSDIVDSDNNIKITEITYKEILADQENDVLLPLKTGNKWYYDVTEYDNDGSVNEEYIDSVEVISEVILGDENWFEVSCPFLAKENIFLANTDAGLWAKCDNCGDKSFLLAKYPSKAEKFASGYPNIIELPASDPAYYDRVDGLTLSKETSNDNIIVPKGYYDCLEFTSRFESGDNSINSYPVMHEYYSPNTGPVKIIQNHLLTNNPARIYELRSKPDDQTGNNCIETVTINTGDIQKNSTHTENVEIKNNTAFRIAVMDAYIESETFTGMTGISSAFTGALPFGLPSGASRNMDIVFRPTQTGNFTVVIKVMSDTGCFYEITINGKSID